MEVSGQLHASAALPSWKELTVPITQEAGWAPEPVWTLGESNPDLSARLYIERAMPVHT
jgi:hypothetical protein